MCDYSLHNVASRPAKVGDDLRTTRFPHTMTCGFSAVGEPTVAVCLLPGTEIAFEAEVARQVDPLQLAFFGIVSLFTKKKWWKVPHRVGRFRQINLKNPSTHHDAIEFPDGRTILLTQLRVGQSATVLQLPAQLDAGAAPDQRPAAVRSAERAAAMAQLIALRRRATRTSQLTGPDDGAAAEFTRHR